VEGARICHRRCGFDGHKGWPRYTVIARQGTGVVIIAVSRADVANDRALWSIADNLMTDEQPKRSILQLMVWDSPTLAPKKLPMTIGQVNSQIAQININTNTGLRRLEWIQKSTTPTKNERSLSVPAERPPSRPLDLAATSAPAAARATTPDSSAARMEQTVYVTRTGAKYHRAGCRSLARSAIPMKLGDAARVYSPCAVCRPPTL
jgi:hypothetical protein